MLEIILEPNDENGNVLTYGDKVYTWERGRVLKSITEGENTYSYTYDDEGIRTSKTVNGVTTYYIYVDGQIVSQWSENDTYPMIFEYDADGNPVGFTYRNAHYYYLTNQLGDVIGITTASGTMVAYYDYDEWGNLLAIVTATEGNTQQMNVAMANPLRYRGYYYDTETGYYYLQSRYYDPSICRFINADMPEFLGVGESLAKWNLFSYCENNAVNMIDEDGKVAIPWQIKVGLAAGVASAIWEMGKYIYKNWRVKKFSWSYVKGLGSALARGFIRGFVVGLISTIPKAWIYGLIGGSFKLIFMIIDGQVKSVKDGISAFMDGWTQGVFTKTLSNLFAVLFKGCKWKTNTKDLIKFATSTLSSYGISKFFKW